MVVKGNKAKCNNDDEVCIVSREKEQNSNRRCSGDVDILAKIYILDEEGTKNITRMVHHSLALDNGGSTDFGSLLVRLLSNESKSPTDFSEGRVRLSESSGYLEPVEDDG